MENGNWIALGNRNWMENEEREAAPAVGGGCQFFLMLGALFASGLVVRL